MKNKKLSDGIRRRAAPEQIKKLSVGRASDSNAGAGRRIGAKIPTDGSIYEDPAAADADEDRSEMIITHDARPTRTGVADRNRRLAWRGAIAACALAAAIVLFISTVGASMTVTISPRAENVSLQDIPVRFDIARDSADPAKNTIPAERLALTKNLRREFDATGVDMVHARATGTAKIYNQFSSASQTFVKGTRFVTDAGILFRVSQSITVPGAKIEQGKIIPRYSEAVLMADAPGEGANVSGEARMTIPGLKGTPKYDGFYAIAPSGFSGGISGKFAVATAEDIARAQESVTKELSDALENDIAAQVPQGLRYQKTLREIQITRVDAPAAHTAGKTFAVEASGSARALVFRQSDVDAIIKQAVIGSDQTREIIGESTRSEYQAQTVDFDLGRADALMTGAVKTSAIIPQTELAAAVAGRKEGSITDILRSRSDVSGFSISFFPPWISSAPGNPAKIHFIIR